MTTSAHRLLLVAALAFTACGPIEEEEGALGNGDFYYACTGLQDPACPPPQTAEQESDQTLPFPSEIALGGTFGLSYGSGSWLLGTSGNVEQVSSDWISSDVAGGSFTARRVGEPWVIALDADGGLVDMLQLTIVPAAAITVGPARQPIYLIWTPPPPMPYVAGTTHTYAATALDANGSPLAGDVAYSWATSDPSVVAIVNGGLGSPSDTVTVEYVAGGTATLYAWTSTAQGSTTLTVPGGSSSEDTGPEAGATPEDAAAEAANVSPDASAETATSSLDAGTDGDAP